VHLKRIKMIGVKDRIKRVARLVSMSSQPYPMVTKEWVNALHQLDHCDDIRTALDELCDDLIKKYCKNGETKTQLLKPYLDKIYKLKKEVEGEDQ
jgi:hypothetical protein